MISYGDCPLTFSLCARCIPQGVQYRVMLTVEGLQPSSHGHCALQDFSQTFLHRLTRASLSGCLRSFPDKSDQLGVSSPDIHSLSRARATH